MDKITKKQNVYEKVPMEYLWEGLVYQIIFTIIMEAYF